MKVLKSLKITSSERDSNELSGRRWMAFGNIVDSRNAEFAGSDWTAVMEYTEGSVSEFIVCDIVGCVVGFFLKTVGDDLYMEVLL